MNHATNESSIFFLTHTKEYHQSGSVQLREVVFENSKDQHHGIDNYDHEAYHNSKVPAWLSGE